MGISGKTLHIKRASRTKRVREGTILPARVGEVRLQVNQEQPRSIAPVERTATTTERDRK